MKPIESLIQSFNTRQFNAFQSFIKQHAGRKNQREQALLQQMRKGSDELEEWVAKSYGVSGKSRAAYHTQRQRLAAKIEKFLAQERGENHDQYESEILESLHAARSLFQEGEYAWGKRLLEKAEDLAERFNDPLWQSLLFREKLKWLTETGQEDLKTYEDEKERLSRRVDLEQRMGLAEAELQKIIRDHKAGLTAESTFGRSRELLSRHGLEASQLDEVVMVHRMAVILRRVFNAEKRFEALLNFLEVQSDRITELGGYDAHQLNLEVEFDYMLAHARYRNRYFSEALEVLALLYPKINKLSQRQEFRWFTSCVLLEAACRSFSGKNQVAIDLLESNLRHPAFLHHPTERLNLMLNLAVYHFQQNGFYRSKELLEGLGHSDAWIKEQLGTEWLLKWKMIRIIDRIELGETEWAHKQLQSLRTAHETLYQQKTYSRVEVFLRFIEIYMQDPEGFRSPKSAVQLEREFVSGKAEEQDLQAMAYYAWLKSKATGERYYELLLEIVLGEK